MTLSLPRALNELSLTKLRKIFNLLLRSSRSEENENTVSDLGEAIEENISNTKAAWDAALLAFQREYIDPGSVRLDTKKQKQIQRRNKDLMQDVKSAKRKYDHAIKTQRAWSALTSKYTN